MIVREEHKRKEKGKMERMTVKKVNGGNKDECKSEKRKVKFNEARETAGKSLK